MTQTTAATRMTEAQRLELKRAQLRADYLRRVWQRLALLGEAVPPARLEEAEYRMQDQELAVRILTARFEEPTP